MERETLVAIIRTWREELKTFVDVEHGLLDQLVSHDVLTDDQVDLIQSKETHGKQVGQLLDEIIQISSDQVIHFFQALDNTQQTHVSNFIRSNGCRAEECEENWPLQCDQRIMRTLRQNRATLVELVDCDLGLLDVMLSEACISAQQSEYVKAAETGSKRNERLLRIVQRRSVNDFINFVKCLRQTKQNAAAAVIGQGTVERDELPVNKQIKDRISARHAVLLDNLDSAHGLTDELLAMGCITHRQKEFIDLGTTNCDKSARLLNVVIRSSQSDFDKFVECLSKDQWHVRRLLLEDGVVPEIDSDNGKGPDVEEEERRAVNLLMNLLKSSPEERRGVFSEKLIECIENFRAFGAELIAAKRSQSITSMWLCRSKSDLFQFHDLYMSGKLRPMIEELFLLALGSERTVLRTRPLKWLTLNRLSCTTFFRTLDSLSINDESLMVDRSSLNPEVVTDRSNLFQKLCMLPYEIFEALLIKTAGQLFVSQNQIAPQNGSVVITTLGNVSLLWWQTLCRRIFVKRLLRRYFKNFCNPFVCCPQQLESINVEGGNNVCGVAELSNRLYVACYGSSTIHVFTNSPPFSHLEQFQVECLNDKYYIAICSEGTQLYIVDRIAKSIWRLKSSEERKPEKFITTTFMLFSISLRYQKLLATPNDGDFLYLFDETDGKLSLSVKLPESLLIRHAVQSDHSTFIVCHVNKFVEDVRIGNRSVSEVDFSGNVIRSFNYRKHDTRILHFDWPRHMLLHENGDVIVADMMGRHIVLLQSDLQLKRVLLTSLEGQPLGICMGKNSGLLFVVYYKMATIGVYRLHNKPAARLSSGCSSSG
jgi:hypothetical protein